MNVIYFLLPAALLLAFVFVLFYLWAARRDQFEDLDSPARRMLIDAPAPPRPPAAPDHSGNTSQQDRI